MGSAPEPLGKSQHTQGEPGYVGNPHRCPIHNIDAGQEANCDSVRSPEPPRLTLIASGFVQRDLSRLRPSVGDRRTFCCAPGRATIERDER